MRLSSLALLSALLGGCTADVGRLGFSGAAEPFPQNYRELVRGYLDSDDWEAVGSPASVVGRTIMSPRRWYLCVRSGGNTLPYLFDGGRVLGTLPTTTDANLCRASAG